MSTYFGIDGNARSPSGKKKERNMSDILESFRREYAGKSRKEKPYFAV